MQNPNQTLVKPPHPHAYTTQHNTEISRYSRYITNHQLITAILFLLSIYHLTTSNSFSFYISHLPVNLPITLWVTIIIIKSPLSHFYLTTPHNMASISQGLFLTSAMLLSTTLLYVAFSRHNKTNPSFQIHHSNKPTLRSCLYSEEKKRERKKNKKKVKFAENVKEGRERNSEKRVYYCRHETSESGGMPANRIALYNGILRDRVHECSY